MKLLIHFLLLSGRMPITPYNIVRHELIGLKVKVKKSKNKSLEKIKGVVVDETYNTLKIKTEKNEKIVIKKICVFEFKLPNGTIVEVDGRLLVGRPEERIKKNFPKWKFSEIPQLLK